MKNIRKDSHAFRALIVAFLVGLVALLISCGKSSNESAKLRMAGIVFQEDQFFRLILFGMRDAATKHNVELLEANSNNQPEKEFELVNTYASQHVDAIL